MNHFLGLEEENLNQLFHETLWQILANGEEVVTRGLKSKELHPYLCVLSNPLKRTLLYPGRGNNPFATLAETMWVLAGRNDVEWLKFFLPRAPDFSDDGKVWRAGYGPRIREWSLRRYERNWHIASDKVIDTDCRFKVDQVEWVVKQLQKDLYTRQAVISIWDPAEECTVEKTKDYPCNDWLHFMVRNDKLDCEVVVRSNDVLWGFSAINVYEWTVLQEIIAAALGIEVGKYYHYTSSMHMYENHWEKGEKLLKYYPDEEDTYNLPVFKFCNGTIDISKYLRDIELLCKVLQLDTIFETVKHPELVEVYKILKAYAGAKSDDLQWEKYEPIMKSVPFTDLKVSCHYYAMRNIFGKKKYTIPEAIADMK